MDIWLGVAFLMVLGVIAVVTIAVVILLGRAFAARRRQNMANEAAPPQTFPARVVGKRDLLSGGGESVNRTTYYVTFERLDQQRLELEVPGQEFGMLAPGDTGRLSVQGTWYRGFVRDLPPPPQTA